MKENNNGTTEKGSERKARAMCLCWCRACVGLSPILVTEAIGVCLRSCVLLSSENILSSRHQALIARTARCMPDASMQSSPSAVPIGLRSAYRPIEMHAGGRVAGR